MSYKTRSYVLDQELILSAAQALPNATNADSTNVVKYGGNSGGKAKIVVKAKTAVAIASGQTLTISAFYGATTSPTDQIRGKVLCVLTNQTIAAGETICEEIIPDSLPSTYKYVKLNYAASANESSKTVDAYVVIT